MKFELPPEDTTDSLLGISARGAQQLLTFLVAEELYAVEIGSVQEILSWQGCRRVNSEKNYIMGIIEVRGVVIPLVDARVRIGESATACQKTTVIIIVRSQSETLVGLVVDAVCDVIHFEAKAQTETERLSPQVGMEYAKFMVNAAEKMVVVLDVKKFVGLEQQALDRLSNEHQTT